MTGSNVEDCVVRELRSSRRGLKVKGSKRAYTVAISPGQLKPTERTIRDAILSCGLKLVKETKGKDLSKTMEFSNA